MRSLKQITYTYKINKSGTQTKRVVKGNLARFKAFCHGVFGMGLSARAINAPSLSLPSGKWGQKDLLL